MPRARTWAYWQAYPPSQNWGGLTRPKSRPGPRFPSSRTPPFLIQLPLDPEGRELESEKRPRGQDQTGKQDQAKQPHRFTWKGMQGAHAPSCLNRTAAHPHPLPQSSKLLPKTPWQTPATFAKSGHNFTSKKCDKHREWQRNDVLRLSLPRPLRGALEYTLEGKLEPPRARPRGQLQCSLEPAGLEPPAPATEGGGGGYGRRGAIVQLQTGKEGAGLTPRLRGRRGRKRRKPPP